MRFPPIKAIATFVSKAANSNLNLAVQETPKYLTTLKQEVVYKKINDINKWYTKIIGLDEVKLYQDRVFDLQQKLLTAQEKRREIGVVLSQLRKQSNELQDQIHKVKRQDDLQKFLDLMKEETEILKQENYITEMFTNSDREEREIFAAFTNAIRDSYEKQRAQLEYTKYFGLVLSIAGSFLAFMYSSLKKTDLKYFIEEQMREIIVNSQGEVPPSTLLLKNIQENQIKTEQIINSVVQNHQQLLNAIKKQKLMPELPEMVEPTLNINKMPDGEKLLWFSVASLVGLVILKSIF